MTCRPHTFIPHPSFRQFILQGHTQTKNRNNNNNKKNNNTISTINHFKGE